jgi:hypothetical protein
VCVLCVYTDRSWRDAGIIFGPSFIQPKIVTMEKMMSPKPVEAVGLLIELGGIPPPK